MPMTLRMLGSREQRFAAQIGVLVGLVRVDADARPDVGLALGGGDDPLPFAAPGRDVEECPSRRPRGRARARLRWSSTRPSYSRWQWLSISLTRRSSAGISRRGNTPCGCARRKPLATSLPYHSRSSSAAKSRASAAMPIWSSKRSAEVGTTGRIAMARSRTAMNSVSSTARIRSGSVLRSVHGACSST